MSQKNCRPTSTGKVTFLSSPELRADNYKTHMNGATGKTEKYWTHLTIKLVISIDIIDQ